MSTSGGDSLVSGFSVESYENFDPPVNDAAHMRVFLTLSTQRLHARAGLSTSPSQLFDSRTNLLVTGTKPMSYLATVCMRPELDSILTYMRKSESKLSLGSLSTANKHSLVADNPSFYCSRFKRNRSSCDLVFRILRITAHDFKPITDAFWQDDIATLTETNSLVFRQMRFSLVSLHGSLAPVVPLH